MTCGLVSSSPTRTQRSEEMPGGRILGEVFPKVGDLQPALLV